MVRILVEEYDASVLRRNCAGSTPYGAALTEAVRGYLRMKVQEVNDGVICRAFEPPPPPANSPRWTW